MFERYTHKSRQMIFLARAEAQAVGSPYIESEHLLLGLLHEDSDLFAAITDLDLSEEALRLQVQAVHPAGESLPKDSDLPLSNECKRILAYAYEESQRLGDRHLGTEHQLLGILREEGCLAAKLLRQRGANLRAIRKTLAIGVPAHPLPSEPEPQRLRSLLDRAREKVAALRMSPAPGRLSPAGIEFHKYSEKARRVIFFTRSEAQQLGAMAIDPEHLLLGITREMTSAHSLLQSAAEAIRENARNGPKVTAASSGLPLSERSKQVLIEAAEEATRCEAGKVRPEHIWFGIASEAESFATRTLRDYGADVARIRQAIEDDTTQPDSSLGFVRLKKADRREKSERP